jgi:hypothetical protein
MMLKCGKMLSRSSSETNLRSSSQQEASASVTSLNTNPNPQVNARVIKQPGRGGDFTLPGKSLNDEPQILPGCTTSNVHVSNFGEQNIGAFRPNYVQQPEHFHDEINFRSCVPDGLKPESVDCEKLNVQRNDPSLPAFHAQGDSLTVNPGAQSNAHLHLGPRMLRNQVQLKQVNKCHPQSHMNLNVSHNDYSGIQHPGSVRGEFFQGRRDARPPDARCNVDGASLCNLGRLSGNEVMSNCPGIHVPYSSVKIGEDAFHKRHRRQMDPEKYNGKTSVEDFIEHFEQVSLWNQWNGEEKALQLEMCLRGAAKSSFKTIPEIHKTNYLSILSFLRSSFGRLNEEILFQDRFWQRKKCAKEDLVEYAHDLKLLASKAFKDMVEFDNAAYNSMIVNRFVSGIGDADLGRWVYMRHPANIDEALSVARDIESYEKLHAEGPLKYKQCERINDVQNDVMMSRVHHVHIDEDDKSSEGILGFLKQMANRQNALVADLKEMNVDLSVQCKENGEINAPLNTNAHALDVVDDRVQWLKDQSCYVQQFPGGNIEVPVSCHNTGPQDMKVRLQNDEHERSNFQLHLN